MSWSWSDDSESSENELLPLKTILSNLKGIANEVRTNSYFCRNMKIQLEDYGYYWFGDISNEREDKEQVEQVMKVLAVAVNEAIQKKVDLQNQNTWEVNQELRQLLDIDKKILNDYFFPSVSPPHSPSLMPPAPVPWTRMLQTAKSPVDMAEHLRGSALQELVKKMIEHQFDIRWDTRSPNGEPSDYTFYEFCDKENTTKHFKYKPRQAHVKATLYKECRMHYLRSITKEKLCPKVYIRTVGGWKSWQADNEGKFNDVNIENDSSWINPSIRKFITENADEQKVESLEDSLAKPTLYWAVLNDRDFQSGDKLKLESIGQTQVYVGKANNGIRGRWTKDTDNHCAMMKKCLVDNVCGMTTYEPLKLEGIQLVDARLALAKVRKEKTALFVIKTFGDDVEKAEIVQQKAQVCFNEAQRHVNEAEASFRTQTAHLVFSQAYTTGTMYGPTPYQTPALQTRRFNTRSLREALPEVTPSRLHELKAEVEKRQEELDEAIAVVNDLKDLKTNKAEAEAQLTRAEKWHRKGKRVHETSKNIIPYKDYKISWKPTDMGYGMNFN